MDGQVLVNVPHGFWEDGLLCREVGLRPVNSSDERFLLESTGALVAARANELLTRCLVADTLTVAQRRARIQSLVAGDREALLLHLRRISFGETFEGVFNCGQPGCDATLEVELRIADLLLPPYRDAEDSYCRTIQDGGVAYEVSFRLPTAGDQEAVAQLARTDAERAARMIFERCVSRVESEHRAMEIDDLPFSFFDKVAALMEELDPQVVIELALKCPACGKSYSAQCDVATFLLQELDQRADRLLRDIHTLAVWYHWSEEAILGLPRLRRERYLNLIAAETGA
jgi:hypothetical protein